MPTALTASGELTLVATSTIDKQTCSTPASAPAPRALMTCVITCDEEKKEGGGRKGSRDIVSTPSSNAYCSIRVQAEVAVDIGAPESALHRKGREFRSVVHTIYESTSLIHRATQISREYRHARIHTNQYQVGSFSNKTSLLELRAGNSRPLRSSPRISLDEEHINQSAPFF